MPQDLLQPQNIVLQLPEGGRDLLCPTALTPVPVPGVLWWQSFTPILSSQLEPLQLHHQCSILPLRRRKLREAPDCSETIVLPHRSLSIHLHLKCIKALSSSLRHRHSPTFGHRTKREAPGAAKCGIPNDAHGISNDARGIASDAHSEWKFRSSSMSLP